MYQDKNVAVYRQNKLAYVREHRRYVISRPKKTYTPLPPEQTIGIQEYSSYVGKEFQTIFIGAQFHDPRLNTLLDTMGKETPAIQVLNAIADLQDNDGNRVYGVYRTVHEIVQRRRLPRFD